MVIIWVFYIIITNYLLARRFKEKMVQVQTVFFSILILLLYLLAFVRKMWCIDYFAITGSVLYIFLFFFSDDKKTIAKDIMGKLCEHSYLIFLFVAIVGAWALSHKAVVLNDELNFWAVDTKSLFFLQGYAEKGFSCSAGYGGYPPACQLAMAFFMHVGGYKEGLMMSGLFLITYVFICPLIIEVPKKIVVYMGTIIWLFIIFSFGPDMFLDRSADVFMAVVYGCILLTIVTSKNRNCFYYIKISLMSGVLVITKSIGIQWMLFVYIFWMAYEFDFKIKKQYSYSLILPVMMYVSWNMFCKWKERKTYLVALLGNSIRGVNDDIIISHGKELAVSFFEALFVRQQDGMILGLSIAGMFFIFIISLLLFLKFRIINKKEFTKLFVAVVFSGIVEYAILLFSIETMFIGEYENYKRVSSMIVLLRRYGAPYIIGTTMMILGILFDRTKTLKVNTKIWVLVIIFSLAVSPIEQQWVRIFAYRKNPSQIERSVYERAPQISSILEEIDKLNDINKKLYIIIDDDIVDIGWIERLLIPYYAAPIPTSIEVIDSREYTEFVNNIKWNRYDYIMYVTENNLWTEMLFFDTQIEPYKIYRVINDDENIYLKRK